MAIHNDNSVNRWISNDFGFQNPSKENSIRSYSSRVSKIFGWFLLKSGFALKINNNKSPLLNRKSLIKFINSHKSLFFGDVNASDLSTHTQSKRLKDIFNARLTNSCVTLNGKKPESHGPAVVTGVPIGNRETTDQFKVAVDTPKRAEAAIKIQSLYRGYLARKELKILKITRQEQIKNAAAVKIQSRWRGILGRKMSVEQREKRKEAEKNEKLLNLAKVYLDDPSKLGQLRNEGNSKAPLYLPSEYLVTLRQITVYNSKIALQIKQGKDLCEKYGYQDLVVPRTVTYKDYLISERLPLSYKGSRFQIGLYHADHESFTDAIKQLTKFVCRTEFNSLINPDDPLQNLTNGKNGRIGQYKKISLFLVDGKGKIGLLDFDEFRPHVEINSLFEKDKIKPDSTPQEAWDFFQTEEAIKYLRRCNELVSLFPYHLEEIMEAALEFDPDLESYRKNLETTRNIALETFKVVHIDHLAFIMEKNISKKNPAEFAQINERREEELKAALKVKLLKLHAEERSFYSFSELLGDNQEAILESFNKDVFPELLKTVKHLIISFSGNNPQPQSKLEILSARTSIFSHRYKQYTEIVDSITPHLKIFKLDEDYKSSDLANILIKALMKKFIGKEIALFNSNFDTNGGYAQCIFW